MGIGDFLILAVIALLAVFALIYCKKSKGGYGSCKGCSEKTGSCKNSLYCTQKVNKN